MNTDMHQPPADKRILLSAGLALLLASDFPDVLFSFFGPVPGWILLAKLGVLVVFCGLCLLWNALRSLRPFAVVMLVLFAALNVSEWVSTQPWWLGLIKNPETSFALGFVRPFARDTGVMLLVLAALWILKRNRAAFFLTRGQLDAPIEPVRWLGIGKGESWRKFGWIFAVSAAAAVAIPTLLALQPSGSVLLQAAAWLPAVLLFAAINAFNEELYYRTTLLSTLTGVLGKNTILLFNAVFFGLAHYLYGSPPGIIGFLMTGFLAWLMGKSMLETKGFVWAWVIHFLPDAVIFFSYAIAWVQHS